MPSQRPDSSVTLSLLCFWMCVKYPLCCASFSVSASTWASFLSV